MIEILVQDVHIDFGFKKILRGAGFEIQTGEKAAVVGGNGSGKSTLLKIIVGELKCDSGSVALRKGASIGYLEQESEIDCGGTVGEYIKEAQRSVFELEDEMHCLEARMSEADEGALEKLISEYGRAQNKFAAMSGYETDENFNRICTAFKFGADALIKNCRELSGGQKTVVKLAKILLLAPDILLLDEPTNHLDIETLEWLEDFIIGYRGTAVVVSHDRYFLDKIAKKTILLEQGAASVYAGNYSYCLREQERLMMIEFEQYKNRQRMIEAMRAAIKRFREWGALNPSNKAHHRRAANMEKRIEKLDAIERPRTEPDILPLALTAAGRSGKRTLTIKDLCFSYGGETVFFGAEAEVLYRERVALLGQNGAGKTTLIRLILKQIEPSSGTVDIAESAKIGYIEQEIAFEDESATVLRAFREDARIGENDARRILARFFICGDEVYKKVGGLSGGERVILRLAMVMQRPVNFLILDEPTNHLDIDTVELLEASLADYRGTLLFVSHDRYFINKIATKVISVGDGRFETHDGNYDRVKNI